MVCLFFSFGFKASTSFTISRWPLRQPAAPVTRLSWAVDFSAIEPISDLGPRVVSMPSWEIFEHQPQAYRDSVLPPNVKARVAVEQGSILGWDRYVGNSGRVIGMNTFGASAPLKELQKKFGFEPNQIVMAAKEQLKKG